LEFREVFRSDGEPGRFAVVLGQGCFVFEKNTGGLEVRRCLGVLLIQISRKPLHTSNPPVFF